MSDDKDERDALIERIRHICVKLRVTESAVGEICHEVRHAPLPECGRRAEFIEAFVKTVAGEGFTREEVRVEAQDIIDGKRPYEGTTVSATQPFFIGVDRGQPGGDFTGYACSCGQIRVSTDGPCTSAGCPIPPIIPSASGRSKNG